MQLALNAEHHPHQKKEQRNGQQRKECQQGLNGQKQNHQNRHLHKIDHQIRDAVAEKLVNGVGILVDLRHQTACPTVSKEAEGKALDGVKNRLFETESHLRRHFGGKPVVQNGGKRPQQLGSNHQKQHQKDCARKTAVCIDYLIKQKPAREIRRDDSRYGQKHQRSKQDSQTPAICREKLPCPAEQLSPLHAVRTDLAVRVRIPHPAYGTEARLGQIVGVNVKRLPPRQSFRVMGKQANRLQTAVGKERKKNSLPRKVGDKNRRGASFLHGKPADPRQGVLFFAFVFPSRAPVRHPLRAPIQHEEIFAIRQQPTFGGLSASVPVDKTGQLQPSRIYPQSRQRLRHPLGHPIHTQHSFLLSGFVGCLPINAPRAPPAEPRSRPIRQCRSADR